MERADSSLNLTEDAAAGAKQTLLASELAYRLAAIDLGSNSIRLLVAEALAGGSYRILDEQREMTRLGRGVNQTGRLDDEAVEKSLAALRRFKQIAEGYQVAALRTVATSAVRDATNGPQFCRRVADETGLNIEVVSAEKEALLAFASVNRAFDLTGKNIALADIGGGSTEIVLASGNLVEAVYTTRLGAVRLTEIYGNGQSLAGRGFRKLVDGIDRRLWRKTKKPMFVPHLLFGSGGTFTSLAAMVMANKGQVGLPTRGYTVSRAEVRHLLDRLRKMSTAQRRSVSGLSPDRADIIVAGLAVVDRIMGRFDVNLLQVHNRGVRDGLMLSMIDQVVGHAGPELRDGDAAIERLAANCGAEAEHGRHVAHLAGSIYSQLTELFSLDPADQRLLEAAARLQDVGYLIDYDQHHKHSYHLILNSRLPDFQPHELEIVANVARYHRGAKPKRRHANFRQLSKPDRRRVRRLSAILRLAGGLDLSHSQQVKGVDVRPNGKRLDLLVIAPSLPEVDVWGGRHAARRFEKAFKTKLDIQWQEPGEGQKAETEGQKPETGNQKPEV